MKKYLALTLILVVVSCKKDQTITHEVINFDKQINDTIIPIKGEYYGAKFIHVVGYVDDSIYVSFGNNYKKHYLLKEIDTTFSTDYYGEDNAIFEFNPYRGKKGKLNITFSISK